MTRATPRSKISRRALLKGSALATGAFFVGGRVSRAMQVGLPASPPTTPWLWPLAFSPHAVPLPPGVLPNPLPIPENHQRWDEFEPVKYYDMPIGEGLHFAHPQLPGSLASCYNNMLPGPTFIARYGEPMFVRWRNQLPAVINGFGNCDVITHVHNGHHASESDGFPADCYSPGFFKDHHYPNIYAGGDPAEAKSTLWYHDHRLDYTAQNTVRGLAGFYILFDQHDSGDENDPNPDAFRLPSGIPNGNDVANKFDIPMVLTDRTYNAAGNLTIDPFNMDGLLGDKFLVNGRIQPYFNVQRRKYRFRILDGGPSRFYDIWFSNGMNFQVIGNDGNLLPAPVTQNHHVLSVAERVDIIVDFSQLPANVTELYLVNRAEQIDGRGPTGITLPMSQANQLLKFNIMPAPTPVPDPSRVPAVLKPMPAMNLPVARRRTWVFGRQNGMWTVNNLLFDPSRCDAYVKQNTAEVWTLKNGGGGWAHPIHIHLEEYHLLERNKRPVVSGSERARKDVFRLGAGEEVKIYCKFRDFLGRYPMHCHNTLHEDHAMMVRFDIIP